MEQLISKPLEKIQETSNFSWVELRVQNSIALVNMDLNTKPTHFKGVLIKFVVFRDT